MLKSTILQTYFWSFILSYLSVDVLYLYLYCFSVLVYICFYFFFADFLECYLYINLIAFSVLRALYNIYVRMCALYEFLF